MLAYNAYTYCPRPPARASDKPARERTIGEQLLAEIEAFMQRNPQVSANRFGREAVDNNKLVERLQQGLNPQPVTVRRVRQFIKGYGS